MPLTYNAKILLKSGQGYPGTVLEIAEAGYDISSNKLYIGNGIGFSPIGVVMDPSYDYLATIIESIEASMGPSFSYIDGSLIQRDQSINLLYEKDLVQDASILLRPTFSYVDGSLQSKSDITYVDSSLKTIQDQYIPNASLGNDFYWDNGLLEVSVGSIVTAGLNLEYDTSGNLAVVQSPNFYGDVSINQSLFVNRQISLKNYILLDASAGNIWWNEPRLFFRDGSTNRDILQGSLKGEIYPASPSEGDQFYRTNNGLLFVYDGIRNKYLSASRQLLIGGRTSAVAGTTTYIRVGDAVQSSTSGFRMFRNGTITSFSVDNNNILTAPRTLEIRINDTTVQTIIIDTGNKAAYNNQINIDFNEGDFIQVSALAGAGGSALSNWITITEVAWRS